MSHFNIGQNVLSLTDNSGSWNISKEWIVRVLFYLLQLENTYNVINRDSNFLEENGESRKIQITEKYGYLNQTTSIQLQFYDSPLMIIKPLCLIRLHSLQHKT